MRMYIDITDIGIPSDENNYDELVAFADAIAGQEIIQLPEQKKGKWVRLNDIDGFVRCSNCETFWDYSIIDTLHFHFCPNCGSYNGGKEIEIN